MSKEFRSTKSLGLITGILLLAGIGFDALTFLLGLIQRSYFSGIWTQDQERQFTEAETIFVLLYLLILVLGFIVFISTAGFFLAWIKRSYQNLSAFNVQALSTTPGWAVGYWFIPILSFYYPLRIVNEIYHGSRTNIGNEKARISDTSTPLIHGFWWALWLICGVGGNITFRISMSSENASMIEFAETLDLILLPVWMICGWLAYMIVKNITRFQDDAGSGLSGTGPPAPPAFGEFHNGSI